MKEDLLLIPKRIQELREILDIDKQTMATRLNISYAQYCSYEDGTADIPISMLYDVASVLGVSFTVLLTGDQPRMDSICVVRSGEAVKVDRYDGYTYEDLSYNFIGRVMEPMLVTIEPTQKPVEKIAHHGQEFNYVLSGTMKVTVGARETVLNAGDSIYFNPALPHAQEAIGDKATFITVINDI